MVEAEKQDGAAEIMLAFVLKEVGGSVKVTRATTLEDVKGIEVVEEEDGILVRLVAE